MSNVFITKRTVVIGISTNFERWNSGGGGGGVQMLQNGGGVRMLEDTNVNFKVFIFLS